MGKDPETAALPKPAILKAVEDSLRRLQTDYIDLYQIHRPQSDIPIEETLRALDDLIRAGKVRYIGTSTFAAWQVVEALWAADRLGTNRFICEQPPYNLLDRRIERELLPALRTYGFAVIPWSPLAGGILTGKYSRNTAPGADTRFGHMKDNPNIARRYTDRMFDVTEALAPLAEQKGCTMAQLALAWVLGRPGVTSPIIGPRTMEQLEDNLGADSLELSKEQMQALDRASAMPVTYPYDEAAESQQRAGRL